MDEKGKNPRILRCSDLIGKSIKPIRVYEPAGSDQTIVLIATDELGVLALPLWKGSRRVIEEALNSNPRPQITILRYENGVPYLKIERKEET